MALHRNPCPVGNSGSGKEDEIIFRIYRNLSGSDSAVDLIIFCGLHHVISQNCAVGNDFSGGDILFCENGHTEGAVNAFPVILYKNSAVGMLESIRITDSGPVFDSQTAIPGLAVIIGIYEEHHSCGEIVTIGVYAVTGYREEYSAA